MNHTSKEAGIAWAWNAEEQVMTATAVHAYDVGEELLDSYGPRSNGLLWRTYGFTQAPSIEPDWTIIIRPELILPITEVYLGNEPWRQHLHLSVQSINDALTQVLNFVVTTHRDATEFLRIVCARVMWKYEHVEALKPALVALARARAKDPASPEWWNELDEEHRSMAESSPVRVQMSEYLCLTLHFEVVELFRGNMPEERCIGRNVLVRPTLLSALKVLREGGCIKVQHAEVKEN
eukprot:NODE_7960_length_1534_cov_13.705757.p1 GENE.NODE_7960_length_1534_cov_13.705757~~NODE_7960_length_1534_cov_13.705757.p1  ORF type:complete len:236 (+),score=54.17 NODE_7960_length_1534_cov_13.705757:555-1262(+)